MKKTITLLTYLIALNSFSQQLYNQWIWVDGSKNAYEKVADFGLIGLEDINNWPYSRKNASGITDNNGNLILFGGWFEGQGASNELWSYNPTSTIWTYKKGTLYKYFPGIKHSEGVGIEHRKNKPELNANSQVWKDNNGNLWTFGGSSNSFAMSNDIWKYNIQTNNWTQVTPDNGNPEGTYGTKGVESPQNVPPITCYGTTWTDSNGNLWMFGGQRNNNNYYSEAGWDSFNSLWKYNITTGNWTWISGSNTINELGSYAVQGAESPLNHPGARSNAASWVDNQGNLWLFGGFGAIQTGAGGSASSAHEFNDVWKFNPTTNLWTWVKGTSSSVENIVTFNTEHPNNMPIGVEQTKPIYWTDSAKNFWYFDGTVDNRIWMFNSITKNWILKKQLNSWLPVYGTLGTASTTNAPGKRVAATTWTSTSGDFYLFSGSVYPSDNGYNDLWKYSINDNSWTWVKGFPNSLLPSAESPSFQRVKLAGEYHEDVNPGYFDNFTASWNDSQGNLWIFGLNGEGYDDDVYVKNHLWKYNSSEKKWQWINGLFDWPRTSSYYDTHGTLGVEDYKNNPVSRIGSMSWIDQSDNLWLFGGSDNGYMNDLWKYNQASNKWVWIKGSNQSNQETSLYGVYGTQGVAAPTNNPGCRSNGASWTDNNGNLWLFGGNGASSSSYGRLNDLWKYDITTNQWTWVKGSNSVNQAEVSAGIGVADPNNTPAGNDNLSSWKDNDGNFWLFTNGALWKFINNNWIKIKDVQTRNYGTIGVYSASNSPGLRNGCLTWVDVDGSLLLFGGDSTNNYQDLWKYNIVLNQWVWIGGIKYNSSNEGFANYGQLNESFISNIPGKRNKSATWKDNNGNLYLYGGLGNDQDSEGKLSDIWMSNRNFSTFTGNVKFNSGNDNCATSTINVPDVRISVTSITDNKTTFSNSLGNFSDLSVSQNVTITPSLDYYTFSPSSQTLNFNTFGSSQNTAFCATANGNHNDLEIVVIPLTDAVPGFDSKYKIVYKNKGTTTLSGSLSFNYESNSFTYISSTFLPASQNTGNLNWNYVNLAPFQTRSITVTLKVNTPTDANPVNSGDILSFSANIIPDNSDETASDNSSILNQIAVNAFDPNDKTCLEGETVTSNYINEFVHYTIRFENTGTAKAKNIIIDDYIDTSRFDISTIRPLDASHNYKMDISENNKVSFIFEGIDLPFAPSTLRYGYITFKIKTKATLTEGDTFANGANIYFDYNLPIQTNQYVTTISNTLGQQEIEPNSEKIKIYPNPVNEYLTINSQEAIKKIEFYDAMGRIVQSIISPKEQINVAQLKKGVYSIKVYFTDNIYTSKLIKN